MKDDTLEQILLDARQQAASSGSQMQSWPLVVFSVIGAWLVAVPALAFVIALVFMVFHVNSSLPFYLIGAALLIAGEVFSRDQADTLFKEQLGACLILCGYGLLCGVIFIEFPAQAPLTMAAMAVLAALVLGPDWLRGPFGAIAAYLLQLAWGYSAFRPWYWVELNLYGLYTSLAVWMLVMALQFWMLRAGLLSKEGLRLEAVADGGILASCAGMAVWSGNSFLLSEQFSFSGYAIEPELRLDGVASALLTLVAGAWFLYRWRSLLNWRWCGALSAFAGLAIFSPALGAVSICLAACALNGKRRMAIFNSICMAWIIGSAYYQLSWPLTMKAAIFASAGGVLLLCALYPGMKEKSLSVLSRINLPEAEEVVNFHKVRFFSGLCLISVLLTANVLIVQREYQIEHGAKVFVHLAPRDPRSLMQGDYMALNTEINSDLGRIYYDTGQRRALLKVGADGIVNGATSWELGRKLEKDEFPIIFEIKSGRPVFASDAWYFTEGEMERWRTARYGEYRITASGRALLVGLRGEKLSRL